MRTAINNGTVLDTATMTFVAERDLVNVKHRLTTILNYKGT